MLRFSILFSILVCYGALNTGGRYRFSVHNISHRPNSRLRSFLRVVDPTQAKSEFFFFFVGGSGALGIGFAQVPKIWAEIRRVQQLKGGPTAGGDLLPCNPLATVGYPEPLRLADVQQVLREMPSCGAVQSRGAKKSYMAQLGCLEREAFFDCYGQLQANPLALHAVFEAMSGGGGDLVPPRQASAAMQRWAEGGVEALSRDLLAATVKKLGAYAAFVALNGLVIDLIVESGRNAFFP